MTFVFPILLGGLALAGIPILLHLILRQKPKTLPFPAFRFLVQKHRSNLRKLQLRHILLLALRIFLIAALCLALARPRLVHDAFNLSRERPVAAILIFDTNAAMDYNTSDKVSRLDEAKKRGKELLGELPSGSRILVLDTAETVASDRGDWSVSFNQVRQRIDSLKIKPANGTAPRALEQALRLLQTAARGDDEALRTLPRLVCVFSDRTVASWPAGKHTTIHDLADALPATLEGVQQLRATAAPLTDLVKGLRAKLPPAAGKDYPDQALLESIEALRQRAAALDRATLQTDEALQQLIVKTRRQARELRDSLVQMGEQPPGETEDYRSKTLASLHGLLRNLAGVQMLYVDVGVEQPVDVALLQVELPRQPDGRPQEQFAADEKFILRVLAQALGKEVSTAVECDIGKESHAKQVDFKPGEKQTVPFEIDLGKLKLGVGTHALEVKLKGKDALDDNNRLYASIQVRAPRRVLVLADLKTKAEFFARALDAVGYKSEIKTIDQLADVDWKSYDAAYLHELASPSAALWQAAAAYVQKGGGIAIVPGRDAMKPAAYQQADALALMPGTWKPPVKYDPADAKKPGVAWNLQADHVFQHPLMKPFGAWRDDKNIDFIKYQRLAHAYWLLEPIDKKGVTLVSYEDKGEPPAVVERLLDGGAGKVVVFTTPLDDQEPRWNNYQESLTSFPLALALLTTRYLTGEAKGVRLNFQCGVEEPRVPIPAAARYTSYVLKGADLFETLPGDPPAGEIRVKQALPPGNFVIEGAEGAGQPAVPLVRFSVNLPPEKGDLTRATAADVEAVLGSGAIVTAERGVDLAELLKGQWNEPVELFPILMVVLLFMLALENLLANKFYRRED